MMKIINGREVTEKLSAAIRAISRLTGYSERQVTLGEAGAILKTWAGRTKVAKREAIDYRARKRALHDLGFTKASTPGDITINTGTRGQAGLVWVKTQGTQRKRGGITTQYKGWRLAGRMNFKNFQFIASNYHWKRGDWVDIQEAAIDSELAMKRAMQLAQSSAGLARQSVVQIADNLGIKLETVPGGGISPAGVMKARRAMASNGQQYANGTASEKDEQEAGRYFVTLINRLPYWPKLGMDRTLAGVIAGRAGYFRRAHKAGAFTSIKNAAKSYPWMKASLAA